MKKLTDKEFRDKLAKKNPWVEPIGKYTNATTPLLFRCNICGREWYAKPGQIMAGRKCRKCAIKARSEAQRKKQNDFIEELKKRNPTIKPLEEYINYNTPIRVQCLICKNEWASSPNNLLVGKGCKKCADKRSAEKRRKTTQLLKEELKIKNPNVELIDEYSRAAQKALFRCKNCGYEWPVKPNHILSGHGCPKCGGSQKKEHEQFIADLNQINPYINILGIYSNNRTKIQCECKICKHQWSATPNNLLCGTGCSNCDKRNKTSFPEQAIYYYLKQAYPDAVNRYHEELERMELDIFIPAIRTGIEYDGAYYHTNSTRDKRKYNECRTNGIKLIRIIEKTPANDENADLTIIRSKPDNFETLDCCIKELMHYLNKQIIINSQVDAIQIREQYYTILQESSIEAKYPELVSEWLNEKNGSIAPSMVNYGSNDKYWWKCSKCGYEWPAAVSDRTISGKGCPICGRKATADKLRKTNEEFIAELQQKFPFIEALEEYKNYHTRILLRCKRCQHEWSKSPAELFRGQGCPRCSRTRSKQTHNITK